jgi:soluble cytochrome b562
MADDKNVLARLDALEKQLADKGEFDKRIVALGERVEKLENAKPAKGGNSADLADIRAGLDTLHTQLFGVPFGKSQSHSDE